MKMRPGIASMVVDDVPKNKKNKKYWDINYKELLKKRLPITDWLPRYTVPFLLQDILAGFTVSLSEIPQAIAYAGVAGLPTEYGLYSGFMGGFVYAVFGSCKDVNIGPTSILALMLQPHVANMGPDVAVFVSFLGGLIIFVLGLFNLGFVIEFFSYPIIAGFTCAASLEIGSSQINNLFGIPGKSDSFLEAWEQLFRNIGEMNRWDAILGVLSFLLLIALREIKRFGTMKFRSDWSKKRNIFGVLMFALSIARNAIVVVIGIVIAYSLREGEPFRITGEIKAGFPPFETPNLSTNFNGTHYSFVDIATQLNASIIFMPLVAILEMVSVAKIFCEGQSLDATQEILALGVSNMLGSFVSSMPITGAFSRSAINNASGVRTQLGGIFTSIMVFLAIAFLTPTFYYVPKAALAAVIIAAMVYVFEYEAFVLLWNNRKLDLIPFFATFLGGLFIRLEYGILIGIGVNLLFVLYPSARPKLDVINEKISNHQDDIYVLTPKDTVYFPAAEYLRDTVLGCVGDNVIVVINGKHIRYIDITVAKSLVTISREMTKRKNRVIFWRFKPSVVQVCVGVDDSLRKCFKTGDLAVILQNQASEDDSCKETA